MNVIVFFTQNVFEFYTNSQGFQKPKQVFSYKNRKRKIKCGERGSNTRPSDLQSDALPTELSPLGDVMSNNLINLNTMKC